MPTANPRRIRASIRQRPADFRKQFARLGWDTVAHYQTGWRTVDRWIEEEGRDGLMADRRAYRKLEKLRERVMVIVEARDAVVIADFMAAMAQPIRTIRHKQQPDRSNA